ncbi:MAG: hypothetical protein PGN30_13060 [Mycolicibacterium neoaurum]|uniref:hypothetical protein n=1 Tax=Mycolicibacterium neoaurum TaxID=1795 RepID=UPI002FF8A4CD
MTASPAQRAAQMAATVVDKLVEIGVPMDPVVTAEVQRCRQAETAELLTSAAALLAAMAPGSAHVESAAFLIPQLQCRAELLREQADPNLVAAAAMFPQHTRR